MRTWVVLTLLLASLASAGTASEPEITDGTADSRAGGQPACPAGSTACAGPGQVVDIVTGWIEEHEDHLMFAVTTSGSEAHKAYGPMQFRSFFTVAGTEFEAGIHLGQSSTAGGDDAVEPLGVANSANIGTDQYEWTVLRSDLGGPVAGDVMTNLYMTSLVDNAGSSSTRTSDRAPDAEGVEFVFTLGTPPGPALTQLNVTGDLEHAFNGTGGIYAINWAGPANVTMEFEMAGNGTINLTIVDPAGQQAFACVCDTAREAAFMGTAGAWNITLDYSSFNGTARLSLTETPVGEGPAEPGDDTSDDSDDVEEGGNETGVPTHEDTPAVALPLLVVGLVWLARRR